MSVRRRSSVSDLNGEFPQDEGDASIAVFIVGDEPAIAKEIDAGVGKGTAVVVRFGRRVEPLFAEPGCAFVIREGDAYGGAVRRASNQRRHKFGVYGRLFSRVCRYSLA
ncbi:MAG: hypothetical protein CME19_10865 [Gemmatimonadetes bacterium]|nr:hypothetical protein [Gemmatimonadota bacterium]